LRGSAGNERGAAGAKECAEARDADAKTKRSNQVIYEKEKKLAVVQGVLGKRLLLRTRGSLSGSFGSPTEGSITEVSPSGDYVLVKIGLRSDWYDLDAIQPIETLEPRDA
jgi:hypothetical protein